MIYWRDTLPMTPDQIELYRKQYPDEELNFPIADEGNDDVIKVFEMVQNQLIRTVTSCRMDDCLSR